MNDQTESEKVESERLRHVRALVKELLVEADVCASVVLAGREGQFEVFQHVKASWSNLRMEPQPDGGFCMGIRSLAEEYEGRPEERQQHLAWSVGVAFGFALFGGQSALEWQHASEQFDEHICASHTAATRVDPRD